LLSAAKAICEITSEQRSLHSSRQMPQCVCCMRAGNQPYKQRSAQMNAKGAEQRGQRLCSVLRITPLFLLIPMGSRTK